MKTLDWAKENWEGFIPVLTSLGAAVLAFYFTGSWQLVKLAAVLGFIIRGVVVAEVSVVAFKSFGQFIWMYMDWPGHHFDEHGVVKEGTGRCSHGRRIDERDDSGRMIMWYFKDYQPWWGTIRFKGFVLYLWPLVYVDRYSDHNDDKVFTVGKSDKLMWLGRKVATGVLSAAEVSKGRGVAPNVPFSFEWRVSCPYFFWYEAPRDVVTQTQNTRVVPAGNAWVASGDLAHLQDPEKNGGPAIWLELKRIKRLAGIDRARDEWGIEVIPGSVNVLGAEYSKKLQEAAEAKEAEELHAQGVAQKLFAPIRDAVAIFGVSQKDAVELRKMDLAEGGVTYEKSDKRIDISSGDQPINPSFAGAAATAEVVADAVARAFGKRGPVRPGPGNPREASARPRKSAKDLSPEERQKANERINAGLPPFEDEK